MSEIDVDLFVIGGGSGGVRAARIAAGHGARVMLAEEYRLGGTCVIRGCVPKKLMVYASRFADAFADAAGFGWSADAVRFDWETLRRNRDAEVARLEGIYGNLLSGSKVDVVHERATIAGPNAVRLASGRTVRAARILVAVGAWPSMDMPVPGIEHAITSNGVFELDRLPESIVVVGGGYIALEFASVFAGLGSRVTLLHRGDKPLRGFDGDVRDALCAGFAERGIGMKMNTTMTALRRDGAGAIDVVLSDGGTLRAETVLLATGRRPNTGGLGLEAVGIETDRIGAIPVDAYSKTGADGIWAVGDVTNRANLTPVAIREGHAFADTVFGGTPRMVNHDLIATAVFASPEIGTVGLTEEAARERHGDDVAIFRASFRPLQATVSGRAERTLTKLVVQRSTDRVLGVHVVGHDAGEMIQLAGVALTAGATKAHFDDTIAVHPTAAEEFVTMRTPVGATA